MLAGDEMRISITDDPIDAVKKDREVNPLIIYSKTSVSGRDAYISDVAQGFEGGVQSVLIDSPQGTIVIAAEGKALNDLDQFLSTFKFIPSTSLGTGETDQKEGTQQAEGTKMLGEPFQLSVNQTAFIIGSENLGLKFLDVTDSRCPADPTVVCVWQGNVTVKLNVTKNGLDFGNVTISDIPSEQNESADAVVDGYHISLINVSPQPWIDKIKISEYIVTLIVNNFAD